MRNGRAVFKITWHRDRRFDLVVDTRKGTLGFPLVLPKVPRRSAMYRELLRFVESRSSKKFPPHRRIDPRKAEVRCVNRGGNVSLTMHAKAGAYEYGARKLIHLVHEIYLEFLGEYFEYQVEAFDLDPDRP